MYDIDDIDEKYEYDDEEWKRIYGRFKEDFNKTKRLNKPFNELMIDIINDMKLTPKEFAERTTLMKCIFPECKHQGINLKCIT